MSENEHQVLKRYFLGELSEDERDALEHRYFNDQQVFGQLLQVKTELVDDYVRGRLSAADRATFERSYLQNPDRARRVKFAATLATRIDRSNSTPTEEKASEGFIARWIDRLRNGKMSLTPAFALVSLLLLG